MTTPKQMLELADELERAHTLYLNQFGISPNHEIKRGKLAQLLWDDKQTFIEALRLAAIQPQRMPYPEPTREMLDGDPLFEAIWQAIKDWDISRHNNGVYSGPTGNDARHIYDAVSALTRPKLSPIEKIEDGQ